MENSTSETAVDPTLESTAETQIKNQATGAAPNGISGSGEPPKPYRELACVLGVLATELAMIASDDSGGIAACQATAVQGGDTVAADVPSSCSELLESIARSDQAIGSLTEMGSHEVDAALAGALNRDDLPPSVHATSLDAPFARLRYAGTLTDSDPQLAADAEGNAGEPQSGSANAGTARDESSGQWSGQGAPTPWTPTLSSRDAASQPAFLSPSTGNSDLNSPLDERAGEAATRPHSYRISLDSPELGRIVLRVHDQQGLRAHLIAQNEAAYQALAAAMDDAALWLQNAGVSLAEFSLSHGQHEQHESRGRPVPAIESSSNEPLEPRARATAMWSGRLNVLA